MRRRTFLTAAPALLAQHARQQYTADWTSLDSRPCPSWYTDAKFGIFIHWGVYSVPSFALPHERTENPYAEWYWNSLERGRQAKSPNDRGARTWEFHRRVYGERFSYFDFAPLFRAELFDPRRWAQIFRRSGARYVVLTSKHHDGFCLWPSKEANQSWGRAWNSVDSGPRRNLLLDLSESVRREGLRMGIYYSLYEWYNPLWLKDRKRYVETHMMPQFKDVVTHCRPALIFGDGEWDMPSSDWRSPELLAWLFNESAVRDEVVVNDRWGKETRHRHGSYYTTEYTAGLEQTEKPWEENRGMGFSYGYNRMETLADYQSERSLILMLVDLVSRGGNLLLNVGPTGDGRIPVIMEERLVQLGSWLAKNGDAIYGTRPWKMSRQWSAGTVPKLEQKTFRAEYNVLKLVDQPAPGEAHIEAFFTAKGPDLYAILPRWPHREIVLDVPRVQGATLVSTGDRIPAVSEGERSRLVTGDLRPEWAQAYAIRLRLG